MLIEFLYCPPPLDFAIKLYNFPLPALPILGSAIATSNGRRAVDNSNYSSAHRQTGAQFVVECEPVCEALRLLIKQLLKWQKVV